MLLTRLRSWLQAPCPHEEQLADIIARVSTLGADLAEEISASTSLRERLSREAARLSMQAKRAETARQQDHDDKQNNGSPPMNRKDRKLLLYRVR